MVDSADFFNFCNIDKIFKI